VTNRGYIMSVSSTVEPHNTASHGALLGGSTIPINNSINFEIISVFTSQLKEFPRKTVTRVIDLLSSGFKVPLFKVPQ